MSIGIIAIISFLTVSFILGISILIYMKTADWSKSRDIEVTITRVEKDRDVWLMYYEYTGNEYCVKAMDSGEAVPVVGDRITVYFHNGTTYLK